jgi:hypothetical protein
MVSDVGLCIIGLVLRYVCFQGKHLIPWYLKYFLVHSSQLSMHECVFLYNRGGGVTTELLLLPPECPAVTRLLSLPFLLFDEGSSTAQFIFPLLGSLGQLLTCLFLKHCYYRLSAGNVAISTGDSTDLTSSNRSSSGSGGSSNSSSMTGGTPALVYWYWLSPVSILAAALSPLPGIHHALYLAAITTATATTCSTTRTASDTHPPSPSPHHHHHHHIVMTICLLACCTLLLSVQPQALPLVLALLIMSNTTSTTSATPLHSTSSTNTSSSISTNTTSSSGNISQQKTAFTSLPTQLVGSVLIISALICAVGCFVNSFPLNSWQSLASLVDITRPQTQLHAEQEYFPGFGVMW